MKRSFPLLTVVGFCIAVGAPVSGKASTVSEIEARAKAFNERLKASPDEPLNAPVGQALPDTRNLKTVLPGVLYRAGGPRGQRDISDAGLKKLCEAGFAKAYYLYPKGFRGTRTIRCEGPEGVPNAIEYVQAGYLNAADKRAILRDVHQRAQDAATGPVLVHCWNGFHASGEIAAVALMQFCGYRASEANAYWMKNQEGAQLISRIGKFEDFSELRLPSDVQGALCPRD